MKLRPGEWADAGCSIIVFAVVLIGLCGLVEWVSNWSNWKGLP